MRKTQNPRNILYLVLSIVIAAGIWYYVDEFNGRVVTQTVTGIPIEYINQDALADNGLMLAEGEDSGTSTTIDITFKGNRRHIVQLDRSKIRVTANLASITEAGVQSVKPDLTYTDRKFNSGNTSVEEQSLYMATVNICELSHKEVELRCELTGNVAEGYSAGKVQLSQTSIAVRGQEEETGKSGEDPQKKGTCGKMRRSGCRAGNRVYHSFEHQYRVCRYGGPASGGWRRCAASHLPLL